MSTNSNFQLATFKSVDRFIPFSDVSSLLVRTRSSDLLPQLCSNLPSTAAARICRFLAFSIYPDYEKVTFVSKQAQLSSLNQSINWNVFILLRSAKRWNLTNRKTQGAKYGKHVRMCVYIRFQVVSYRDNCRRKEKEEEKTQGLKNNGHAAPALEWCAFVNMSFYAGTEKATILSQKF